MAQQVDEYGYVLVAMHRLEEDDFICHGIKTKFRRRRTEFATVDDNAAELACLTQSQRQRASHLLVGRRQCRHADRDDFYARPPQPVSGLTNGSPAGQDVADTRALLVPQS